MKGVLLALLALSLTSSVSIIHTDISAVEKRFHLSFSEDEKQ